MSNPLLVESLLIVVQTGCTCVALYFKLTHDDLNVGAIQPLELTTQLADYLPFEMYAQIFMTFLFAFTQNYFLFLVSVPLAILHFRSLQKQDYKQVCFTMKEYTNKSKNERTFLYKTIFYIAMLVFLFVRTCYEIYNQMSKGAGWQILE